MNIPLSVMSKLMKITVISVAVDELFYDLYQTNLNLDQAERTSIFWTYYSFCGCKLSDTGPPFTVYC